MSALEGMKEECATCGEELEISQIGLCQGCAAARDGVEDDMICPKCGGADVSAEVKTWCRFTGLDGRSFDDEDLDYVDRFDGGARICYDCQHEWH